MGCGKTKDPLPPLPSFSSPRFLFPLRSSARTNFARDPPRSRPVSLFFAPRVPHGSLHSPARRPCRPLLFVRLLGCREAQRHEKKESGIGPSLLSSRSHYYTSHSVSSSVVLALVLPSPSHPLTLFAPAAVAAAARWFVNAKFKLSRAALLKPCDANEGTNTSILSKSLPPTFPPLTRATLQTPKRAYQ